MLTHTLHPHTFTRNFIDRICDLRGLLLFSLKQLRAQHICIANMFLRASCEEVKAVVGRAIGQLKGCIVWLWRLLLLLDPVSKRLLKRKFRNRHAELCQILLSNMYSATLSSLRTPRALAARGEEDFSTHPPSNHYLNPHVNSYIRPIAIANQIKLCVAACTVSTMKEKRQRGKKEKKEAKREPEWRKDRLEAPWSHVSSSAV